MAAAGKGKFTPAARAKVLSALRAGMTEAAAAGVAGVHRSQVTRWKQKSATFATECAVAEQEAEARMTGAVIKAVNAGDAKMALEWLKRRRRQDWGDSSTIRFEKMTDEQLLDYVAGLPIAVAEGGPDSPGDREAAGVTD